MVDTRNTALTRKLLGQFLDNPETIRAFEDLSFDSADLADVVTAIQSATIITLAPADIFENERVLSTDGEVVATDGGVGGNLTLGLSDTGVDADTYGGPAHLVQIAINAKGRIILAQSVALDSDNVAEGAANLFFTQDRARNSLASGDGISYIPASGTIAIDPLVVATLAGAQTMADKTLSSPVINGARLAIRAVSDPVTIGANDTTLIADASAGALSVPLPSAVVPGRVLVVKKSDASANAVTITPVGAETIDGAASLVLTSQYETARLQSDGALWWVV